MERTIIDRQSKEEIVALVSLTAQEVQVFQPPRTWVESSGGGNDIDCIVRGLDPAWPLRLPRAWRLVQALRYRSARYQWWLERDGQVLIIDTTGDPPVTLEAGISSPSLLSGRDLEGSPTARAIYLTKKRLLKRMVDPEEWRLISLLANEDQKAYTEGLVGTFGRRWAERIAVWGLSGTPPDGDLVRRTRRARSIRYALHPLRTLRIAMTEMTRIGLRLLRPTGFHVLVVGPDGSGKSTVAERMLGDAGRMFRRRSHIHWRPGIFPRLGALIGRSPSDASQPHTREPYGKVLAQLVLVYYWLDFFLGGWLLVQGRRVRTGLVVQERGWWDLAVDPRRYRLRPSPRTVLVLGKLLPKPDMVVVLESDPAALHSRKAELTIPELQRQVSAWRDVSRFAVRPVYQDTSRSLEETLGALRREITHRLEARTVSRLSYGWTSLERGRFLIPRGPRNAARTGLSIYQPVTMRGRFAWRAARIAAGTGCFRLLGRVGAPSRQVRELLAEHVPAGGSLAFARAKHPNRYLAMMIDAEGHCPRIAKIAADGPGQEALSREAAAISGIGQSLVEPLSCPELLHAEQGILVLKNVEWGVRSRPWQLPVDVAFSLGRFFREGGSTIDGSSGATHGDFAPWNLLKTRRGDWLLIDWEEASEGGRPFWDVFHFLVQGHALLGRPSEELILRGLDGHGWVADILDAYARGAMIDSEEMRQSFVDYLEASRETLDPERIDGRRGIQGRDRLLTKVRREFGSPGAG